MREETTTRTIYQYDELPTEAAKQAAREWYARGLFDYDWWDYIYEDANTIGLKITEFDIYRGTIDGELLHGVNDICKLIKINHGKTGGTYTLAKTMDLRKHNDDNEDTVREFKYALLQEYLSMLLKEVEYMESTENIEENIRGNEYEFTEGGKIS